MKQEIKQELQPNELAEFKRVILASLIMWVITGQEVWQTFPLTWYQRMRTWSDNHLPKREDKREEDNMYVYPNFPWIINSLDTLQPTAKPQHVEEKKMFDDDFDDENITDAKIRLETRNWFLSELNNAYDVHVEKARDAHHINDNRPVSIEDFIDRIKSDKFSLVNKDRRFNIWDIPYLMDWRVKKADDVGFEKTRSKIDRAFILAKRKIMEDNWNVCSIIEKFEEMNFIPANDNQVIDIAEAA